MCLLCTEVTVPPVLDRGPRFLRAGCSGLSTRGKRKCKKRWTQVETKAFVGMLRCRTSSAALARGFAAAAVPAMASCFILSGGPAGLPSAAVGRAFHTGPPAMSRPVSAMRECEVRLSTRMSTHDGLSVVISLTFDRVCHLLSSTFLPRPPRCRLSYSPVNDPVMSAMHARSAFGSMVRC